MSLDLDTILQSAIAAGVAVVGYLLKRMFVDRIDKLETKLDALIQTIAAMKESNSEDHADVVERISKIEGKLNID